MEGVNSTWWGASGMGGVWLEGAVAGGIATCSKFLSLKSFIVTQQIHIEVKQENEKRHIIHDSAKVYQAMQA